MTVLDKVPTARISARAQQVDVGRILVALIGGLLFVVGWLLARAVRYPVRAAVWAFAAVAVGFADGWAVKDEAVDG